MGFLCPLSFGTSTQLKGKLLNLRPFSVVLEYVHVYVHAFTGRCMYVCMCVLGDNASPEQGSYLRSFQQELLRPLHGSPAPWYVDIPPVVCPFRNPRSQHALVLPPSVRNLRLYSEIYTLSNCWCLKIRLSMRPHGHSIHSLIILRFLWPVIRKPSLGKEI